MASSARQIPAAAVPAKRLAAAGLASAAGIQLTMAIPPMDKPVKIAQEQLQGMLARLQETGARMVAVRVGAVRRMRDEREQKRRARHPGYARAL